MITHTLFLEQEVPHLGKNIGLGTQAYLALVIWAEQDLKSDLKQLFPDSLSAENIGPDKKIILRAFRSGVSNPLAQSLGSCLKLKDSQIRVDKILVLKSTQASIDIEALKILWREPAIEDVTESTLSLWLENNREAVKIPARPEDSWELHSASHWGLEFEQAELRALDKQAQIQGRAWNHAELEVFAQTWSEHCKHKIFAAQIECLDTLHPQTESLFKTHIRQPTFEIMKKRPELYLSVFHDNAGVVALETEKGEPTDWALCLKMETHNSPSAISPYGGASTGVVGVHRDILGTGLGAMPIANWNVLCFESPSHSQLRPSTALPADIIRRGVIKGIEEGGNQSGIPTLQGSVFFDPAYAVKPLVFAGAVGLLPKKDVQKKARSGLKLYCVGGAVGMDGLRGAVMSSRDLRKDDFSGSMVQVANAFTQRRLTDFLLEARDQGLIDCITDNGAGGLASSVGEMASLSGGVEIDLSELRVKFEGLLAWERLLSESQERMTVATSQPELFEKLAASWDVPLDRLGELKESGLFKVSCLGKTLVEIPLSFLHDGCPPLQLKSSWTFQKEREALENERPCVTQRPRVLEDFPKILASPHLCSREPIIRRFDHEVQGRTLRKPFAGETQHSPQDGSRIEIYEVAEKTSFILSHGLAPNRHNIEENVLYTFDEALRGALISGASFKKAGLLDNFCWSDPIKNDRRLWRLVRSCEVLSELCRIFELPLISGKDSMKNNSKDFEVLQTLVLSLGASALDREKFPVGFFTRANDIVLRIPPIKSSLRDSIWERVFEAQAENKNSSLETLKVQGALESQKEIQYLARELNNRYEDLSFLLQEGKIRSAKDISEGGTLTALFELCLGRDLGVELERSHEDSLYWLGEGLGGFVFAVDPHYVEEVLRRVPCAERLGVTSKLNQLRFSAQGGYLNIAELKSIYLQKGQELFGP